MKIQAGLIGLGFATQELKLPGYLAQDMVEIVAIADPNPVARAEIAERLGLGPEKCYNDYAALLANESVDYVDVSTPHSTHLPILQLAAEKGISVVCDKPVAMSVAEVDEMIGIAERSGIRAGVHHNFTHFPSHVEVLRQIKSGAIGRVESITMSAHSIYAPGVMPGEEGWRAFAHLSGGGILMDYGIHHFYLLRNIFGPDFVAKSITARIDKRRIRSDADVEDTASVHIEGERGESATLVLTWGTGTSGHMILDGEFGTLEVRYPNAHSAQHNVASEIQVIRDRIDEPETVRLDWERLPLTWYYGGSIRAFAEYVAHGITEGVGTLEEARDTVVWALAAYESAATDQTVELPLPPSSPLYVEGVTGVHRLDLSESSVVRQKQLFHPATSAGES